MNRIIGKINPDQRHVTIWGAGFSGLVLGYFLKDQGYTVTIYEKSNRIGGKIQTKKTGAGLAEKGAHALYLNQDGLELIKELKLEPIPAAKKLRELRGFCANVHAQGMEYTPSQFTKRGCFDYRFGVLYFLARRP